MKRRPEVFGPLSDFARTQPCLVRNGCCFGRVVPRHVKTRGAGGTDTVGFGNHGNVVPLCCFHHSEGDTSGLRKGGPKWALLDEQRTVTVVAG